MIEKSSSSLERTVLVGIITLEQPKTILEEYLNELNFLGFGPWASVVFGIQIQKICIGYVKSFYMMPMSLEKF